MLKFSKKNKETTMNILIVDDSKIVRRILTNTITRYFETKKIANLHLFEAEDGVEALQMIKTTPINIIFLDWNMPNMTGEELITHVRANKEWNQIRIIMVTTESSKESVKKIIKKGVNGYIVKPFQEDLIIKTLDMLTARIAS